MKRVLINGYLRCFTETILEVEDDFDVEDGELVQTTWNEEADISRDMAELLECSLDAELFEPE